MCFFKNPTFTSFPWYGISHSETGKYEILSPMELPPQTYVVCMSLLSNVIEALISDKSRGAVDVIVTSRFMFCVFLNFVVVVVVDG